LNIRIIIYNSGLKLLELSPSVEKARVLFKFRTERTLPTNPRPAKWELKIIVRTPLFFVFVTLAPRTQKGSTIFLEN